MRLAHTSAEESHGPAWPGSTGRNRGASKLARQASNRRELRQQLTTNVLMEHPGGVQLLINNAGIACDGRMVHTEEASQAEIDEYRRGWDRCFNVDFYGVLYCTRAFLPALRASDSACLVNVSSINAIWTWPEHTAYSAAKAAVILFLNTKAAASVTNFL